MGWGSSATVVRVLLVLAAKGVGAYRSGEGQRDGLPAAPLSDGATALRSLHLRAGAGRALSPVALPQTQALGNASRSSLPLDPSHVLDASLDPLYARPLWQEQEQEHPHRDQASTVQMLLAIGGGTGATLDGIGMGDAKLNMDLERRMHYQDKALIVLLLMSYFGSLIFSASIVYRQASNDSSVTYYADPRYHHLVVDNNDLDSFLEVFTQPPTEVQLQVTGLTPLPHFPEYSAGAIVEWFGQPYHVAFSFALDLSPWVVKADEDSETAGSDTPEVRAGLDVEDLARLQEHLEHCSNDLAMVSIEKEIHWPEWEALAVNIKHQIRQRGFNGVITVAQRQRECVMVYKNKEWANFMHSRALKVICVLSLFGYITHQFYMWLRNTTTSIRCRYRVDIAVDSYWRLISDKIGPEGFDAR